MNHSFIIVLIILIIIVANLAIYSISCDDQLKLNGILYQNVKNEIEITDEQITECQTKLSNIDSDIIKLKLELHKKKSEQLSKCNENVEKKMNEWAKIFKRLTGKEPKDNEFIPIRIT
jgi:peptidoglycan hydrolase CwlO-like protein